MSRQIELADAALEVTVGGTLAPGVPILCAAHPAAAFGESAVGLLQETAGTSVVCVNPRGLGSSSPAPPERTYTLDDMVDDIEGVRRRLGVDRWVFWGISGGGWLGQIYARKYPDALAGLILESICPCFRERLADPDCLLSPYHAPWRAALEERGLIAPDSHAAVGDPNATEWIDVEGVGAVFRRRNGPALLVSPMPVSAEMHRTLPALWTVDARGWLREIRTPTLVICGNSDPIVPLAHARAVHEAIPGSDLMIVEGGGHSPVMARRPDVIEAVQSFVRERAR
ncbi:MAG: alpha/beta hydrolase [Acidobacteria bacterium]|nr:alpha/beta hydrolase [Acidobacteriota bacterium]